MRALTHGDVVAAARVLMGFAEADHGAVARRLIAEARWADSWRKRNGRAHPLWGDGSLMAAALLRRPGPEPSMNDARWLGCLAAVLEALIDDRRQRAEAQETQVAAAGSISNRRGAISSPQSQQ